MIEAFPVDAGPGTSSADLYHGPLSVFEAAGFETVARPSERRAVVRLSAALEVGGRRLRASPRRTIGT